MLRLTSARVMAAVLASMGLCLGSAAHAQGKQLTLCWAAWDPANALVELSKDFTAKTGIAMKKTRTPRTHRSEPCASENSAG